MVKRYGCAGILLFAMGLFPLLAQDNAVAKEMAIKIADRIVASTVYEFKDVKTGKPGSNYKDKLCILTPPEKS